MGKKFIVTAFGKDRAGIVADLSEMLYVNGCNLEDTRMTILADTFASLLLVSAPEKEDIEQQLSNGCRRLEMEKGLSAYVRPVSDQEAEHKKPFSTRTIKVEGLDQTGIVFKVSRYLADNQINIADLSSSIGSAPESGSAIYSMEIKIQVPEGTSMDALSKGLDKVADDLDVEIMFI
jgi:glycine cleavage system transcriptional repressor